MKKNICIIMAIVLALLAVGCSSKGKIANGAEINEKEVQVSNDATVDNDDELVSEKYEEISKVLQKVVEEEKDQNEKKDMEKYIKKFKENMPMLKEMNAKGKKYCENGFYLALHTTNKIYKNENRAIKKYIKDGNYREEQYMNDQLTYLIIYNKDEDTAYYYDVEKDQLDKKTKFGHDYPIQYPYIDGNRFFDIDNNAQNGHMKYMDYKGKKVLYSEYNEPEYGVESKYWYDADTGIILRSEEKMVLDNKIKVDEVTEYTIDVNKEMGKELFQFDKKINN